MAELRGKISRGIAGFWEAVSRTKTIQVEYLHETELKRCLSVIDLISLGVGSTLGAGVYVLTAQVAKYQAGPAVVISFLIAAVASFLAGICYAEFAARVPRAGSAYIYSYVSVGEFLAFVIGWNMILENMIGAASVGKAWSEYFDSLINDTIRHSIEQNVGSFRSHALGEYPDFLAFGLLILATLMVSIGVKMSSIISCVFTVINLLVILCIVAVGAFHADGKNWTEGSGFFPKGFRGVLSGAATCFYAFVGFDTIATSGEEAKKPTHSIPTAIVTTLVICFVAYFGVSSVLTLMVPWYSLSDEAALPKAFAAKGIVGAEYVIAIGGMCGLTASMMGSIFPLPRTIYAMAQDGLIFRFLGRVYSRTNTPFLATWIAGTFGAVLALLLDLNSLVQMMSIGTLMAYTLVAISVLVLHYQRDRVGLSAADMHLDMDLSRNGTDPSETIVTRLERQQAASEESGLLRIGNRVNTVKYVPSTETTVFKRVPPPPSEPDDDDDDDDGNDQQRQGAGQKQEGQQNQNSRTQVVEEVRRQQDKAVLNRMAQYMNESRTPPDSTYQRIDSNYSLNSMAQLFQLGDENSSEPTAVSRRIASLAMTVMFAFWTCLCLVVVYGERYLDTPDWWAVALIVCFAVATVAGFIVLFRQPTNSTKLNFKVPFVPVIPVASVMINIFLMITLSSATWLRFVVWMGLGFIIYFGYGIWCSSERRDDDREVILYDVSDRDSILIDGVYR